MRLSKLSLKPAIVTALTCLFLLPSFVFAQEEGVRSDWPSQTYIPMQSADGSAVSREQELLAFAEQLARDFPNSGSVRARLLRSQLDVGNSEGALESLQQLKELGVVFNERAQSAILDLIGEPHAETARSLLVRSPEVIEASEVYQTVPAEAGLVEGLFASDEFGTLVASSVTGKSIHIFLAGEQEWTSIAIPGADDLSGIVGEPDDSMGWAASANIDGSQDAERGFVGLMGLRTDFQNPILVPAPASALALSDVAIGPDSTVYASDPQGGGIYRKPLGAVEMEELVPPATFRSPQGLAVSADGASLYVSDYRYGLAMVEIDSGTVTRMPVDVPVLVDGIDGLWLYGDQLIAIQNGSSPMRIIALQLSQDGGRITDLNVLEQAHSAWTEPLGGSIAGGYLYYVGTGQWDRYEYGESVPDKPAIATVIRRLKLPEKEQ
ncbi:MAG: hypothetical protein AAF697_01390 [Pseudomonadota bacterium]